MRTSRLISSERTNGGRLDGLRVGFGGDGSTRFLRCGPLCDTRTSEALDDWIDVTTRGLLGLTVACARCHDHKFEPVPTADYYSLRGVFAAVSRVDPLAEDKQPLLKTYSPKESDVKDYEQKRAEIDKKIRDAAGKKANANNRLISQKIRETELAELLLFHPGAPGPSDGGHRTQQAASVLRFGAWRRRLARRPRCRAGS